MSSNGSFRCPSFGCTCAGAGLVKGVEEGGAVTTEGPASAEPARFLTAKPETVLHHGAELELGKEAQVAVVEEPSRELANWSQDPEFKYAAPEVSEIVASPKQRSPAAGMLQSSTPRNRHFWSIAGGTSLLVLLGCLAAMYAWKSMHKSALDFFWGPVFSTNEPVLICIADQNQYAAVALRDAAVAGFGVRTSGEMRRAAAKDRGGHIDFFRIHRQSERELVVGEDDRHLDFRASILIRPGVDGGNDELVVTTVVHCHNRLGRTYLALIAPFHRLIVKTSLGRAARKQRRMRAE